MKTSHGGADDLNRKNIDKDLYRLYIKEVIAIPLLTHEEELDLANRSRQGDTEARRKLVEANLRFVVKTARSLQHTDIPLLDLINEGNIGLIEAARRFNPDKNVRFLTYAVWWIRQAIHHYINNEAKLIPVGSKLTSILRKLRNISISQKEIEPLNREMLSRKIGVSRKELEQALQLSRNVLSFESPSNAGQVLGETIQEDRLPSPEQLVIAKERHQYVKSLMSHLTETEASILEMRFGISSNNRMTLREIGDIFGLTRERIRQIENKSIEKLRLVARNETFHSWLNV